MSRIDVPATGKVRVIVYCLQAKRRWPEAEMRAGFSRDYTDGN